MPPDSDQILAVGQEQTRFPCGERAVLHECIIQIENLLIRQMLTVTQLHIADGQLHRAAASKFVDLQMKGGIHGVALDKAETARTDAEPDRGKPLAVLDERQTNMPVAGQR